MFYKLAFNNIKKSYKDYLIYFVTLTMGITLFYLFNSIESQKVMLKLSDAKSNSLEIVFGAMNFISVFISLALAFLMLYANRFLIKRRKKELGIYLLLGMDRLKVSYLLVMETMIIGFVSLVIGIIAGVVGSHFFSLITARMFLVDVTELRFIFSPKAAAKTTMFFGIIFGLDILLNTWSISRLKLINLLYARRRNQELKITNPHWNRLIFLLSILVLLAAYYCITVNGMMSFDIYFKSSIILGIIGTLLFFMSLSGIMIRSIRLNKNMYYRDLNIFTLRQVGSKVNSTFVLMSVVSIMLLIAIGTFSTGMGMADVMGDSIDERLPFDDGMLIWHNYSTPMAFDVLIEEDYLTSVDYATLDIYESDVSFGTVLSMADPSYDVGEEIYYYTSMDLIGISDYNNMLALRDLEPLELSNEQFLITYNYDKVEERMKWLNDQSLTLDIGNTNLTLLGTEKITLYNEPMLANKGTIVVSDQVLETFGPSRHVINVNYQDGNSESVYDNFLAKEWSGMALNKEIILSEAIGIRTMLSYFAIYVGIVFIMSSVVILALQLLTEVSDNTERYQLLMKLGVDKGEIKKSLFIQISLYFMLPLMLGIIHSYVGLKVSTSVVMEVGQMDIYSNLMTTTVFVVAIYGAYFTTTYATMKAIVLGHK